MTDGEFALLYDGATLQPNPSHGDVSDNAHFCSVLSSLPAAERYAQRQLALHPTLRCRVYDHEGLGKPPLREFRGAAYKGESEITPRIRRWLGGSLFTAGVVLTLIDWHAAFRYMWPSTLGTRLMVPGGTLLAVEAAYQINAAYKRRKEAPACTCRTSC